jgi:hypothetical protein
MIEPRTETNIPYKARFRTGEWTPVAVAGESIDGRILPKWFLERIVKNYNPKGNGLRAKIKIGHTKGNTEEKKAYGYFSELRMSPENPDIMEAKPEWVNEELIERLEKGEYRDISPEFKPIYRNRGKIDKDGNAVMDVDYYFSGVAVLGESSPAFPQLSIDFDMNNIPKNVQLSDITYKSGLIEINQVDEGKETQTVTYYDSGFDGVADNYETLMFEYNKLKQYHEALKIEYDRLQEKNKSLENNLSKVNREKRKTADYYFEKFKAMVKEKEQNEAEQKKVLIVEFCQRALEQGKLEPYELMKERPSQSVEDCGFVKHLLSLNDDQLDFEMKLIDSREEKEKFSLILNNDERNLNYFNFEDDTELEEKKFNAFCKERDFDLTTISGVDKAYKEWRNNGKH